MTENNQVSSTSKQNALQTEWLALHTSYERSEYFALVIKLVSITLCLTSLLLDLNAIIITYLLLTLWLQEAIWKTFQGRTEQRLLSIEQYLKVNDQSQALQIAISNYK